MIATIEDVLEELGVEAAPEGHHHVSSSGNFIGIDCPYCSPGSQRYRMGIARTGSIATCWICGTKPIAEVLSLAASHSLPTALRGDSSHFRAIRALLTGLAAYAPQKRREATGRFTPPAKLTALLPPHRKFLKERGFVPEEIQTLWGVRGIGPASSRWMWRLFIPIHDETGREVSWSTRSLTDMSRYRSAKPEEEEVLRNELLYGEHMANHAVIVVEGFLDAWACGPGGVATMGVGYSQSQLLKISKYPTRAICFDSVPEAQVRAGRLADDLAAFPGETFVVSMTTGKDPSRAELWELERLRKRFLE